MAPSKQALIRARRGAKWLDKKLGRGWRRKIRRTDLDMSSGEYTGKGDCGCIVAQLYGEFTHGLAELGIEEYVEDHRLGLDIGDEVDDYDDLTEAWLTALREG